MTRRRLRDDDGGFTLVELGISMILAAIVTSIMISIVVSVGRSVNDQNQRTITQQSVRNVVADLTRDLRAAIPATGGGTAVTALSADALTFTTLAADDATPEKVVVERVGCPTDCGLRIRRYAATGSGPNWSFESTPFYDSIAIVGVDGSGAMFTGVAWNGSPATRSEITTCGVGIGRCSFTIVAIVVRSTPATTSATERAFEVREEVRIRSV